MPVNINSHADVLDDWEGLLFAIEENPELAAVFEAQRLLLRQVLIEARALKAARDSHVATKQETTRQLKAALVHGRDLAIHLRAAVRGKIGPRSEQLVQFRMTPLRKRSRRSGATAQKEKSESSASSSETVK